MDVVDKADNKSDDKAEEKPEDKAEVKPEDKAGGMGEGVESKDEGVGNVGGEAESKAAEKAKSGGGESEAVVDLVAKENKGKGKAKKTREAVEEEEEEIESKAEEKSGGGESKAKGPTSSFGRPRQPNRNRAGTTGASAWVGYGKEHHKASEQSGVRASSTKRKNEGGAFFAVDSDDDDDFYNSEYGSDSDSPPDSDAEIGDEVEDEEEDEEEGEPVEPSAPSEPGTPVKPAKKERKKRDHHDFYDPMFKSAPVGKKEAAAKFKAEAVGNQAPKNMGDITLRDACDVLDAVLTEDSTKVPVKEGVDVFFDPEKFKEKKILDVFLKTFPYDAGELGVREGTEILVGSSRGKVVNTKHDRAMIEVGGRTLDVSVLFVLEHAVTEQGVAAVEAAQRKFLLFLHQVVAIPDFFIPNHYRIEGKASCALSRFTTDAEAEIAKLQLKQRVKPTPERQGKITRLQKRLDGMTKIRPMIWRVLRKISVQDTLRVVPDEETLEGFTMREGSMLEMLGLKRFGDTEYSFHDGSMGIFGSKLYFRDNSIATELISTLVQSLLQAFRLNRPICLQSVVYPLTLEELKVVAANVEFGKEALEERAKHSQTWNSEPFPKTWALEALFAIGVNWIPDLPLSILRTLNRKDELLPTTLEGAYSKTRVLFTLRKRSMPDNDDRDKPVFKKVFEHFRLIANIVRNEREIYLNNQGETCREGLLKP